MNEFNTENSDILKYLHEVNADENTFQLFVVSAVPSGSGSSSSGSSGGGGGGPLLKNTDIKSLSLSDWVGNVAGTRNLTIQDVELTLKHFFNNLEYSMGVDNFMQLCKIIVDSNNYPPILNDYVLKSESVLYSNITELKSQYQANVLNQLFFNLVRFHVHANVNEFEISEKIINDLYLNWSHIDQQYQYPIIYYKFIYSISNGLFEEALTAMKRYYVILKLTNESIKHTAGLWDDWVAMLMITWFVSKHSISFEKEFFKSLNSLDVNYQMKRKMAILNNLNDNMMIDLMTKPFFDKLKSILNL